MSNSLDNDQLEVALLNANKRIDSLDDLLFDANQVVKQLIADLSAMNRRINKLEHPIPDLPTVK